MPSWCASSGRLAARGTKRGTGLPAGRFANEKRFKILAVEDQIGRKIRMIVAHRVEASELWYNALEEGLVGEAAPRPVEQQRVRTAQFDNPCMHADRQFPRLVLWNGVSKHDPKAVVDAVHDSANLSSEQDGIASHGVWDQARGILLQTGQALGLLCHLLIGIVAASCEYHTFAALQTVSGLHHHARDTLAVIFEMRRHAADNNRNPTVT
jgi:hypothetical protein